MIRNLPSWMGYRQSGGESSNGNKKVLVILSDGEHKPNKDTTVDLLRSELQISRMHMAKLVDAGRNRTATEFAISLLQTLFTRES